MRQRSLPAKGNTIATPTRYSINSREDHPISNSNATPWVGMVSPSWSSFVQLSRLDMPAGSLLIFWPCTWGIFASAYRMHLSPLTIATELPLYFIGSVVLHSAACIWNDVCDKDFDAKVERTKHRPLAAGTMTIYAALLVLLPQLAVLVGLLLLTERPAFEVDIQGLCIWQPIYPFVKRVTYWAQVWLGYVMNWGLLVAWMGNTGALETKLLIVFFFGSCCWTLYYGTIYAMHHKEDDMNAGIKSTALLFGSFARPILSGFCICFIVSLAFVGILNHHGPAYFILTVLGTAFHLLWQISRVDLDDQKSCFTTFDANGRRTGLIVASGMAVDYALQVFT